MFFDSLWIKTNKGMTRALINEISTFVKVYDNEEIIKDELKNTFSLFLDLNIELVNNKTLIINITKDGLVQLIEPCEEN